MLVITLQVYMGAHILGDFRNQPRCGLSQSYFEGRDCWVDCREKDTLVIDATANIGWCVSLICQTHDIIPGMFNRVTGRPIVIGPGVFVGAFSILYNCTIGEGAVVATGSVVRSQVIPPWVVVAGNPAVIVKKFNHATKKWEKA